MYQKGACRGMITHMDNMSGDLYSQAVASILRRHYEATGISYSKLAAQTGLSRPTIERVINGKREATAYYLYRLCEAFGTTPGAVLDEADNNGKIH